AAGISAGFTFTLSGGCLDQSVDITWNSSVARAALVAGSASSDGTAVGNNYGADFGLFAPANGIIAALEGGDDTFDDYGHSKTCNDSFAAPVLSGIAARYLQVHPSATPTAVKAALLDNATIDALSSVHSGTPNRLAYSGFLDGIPAAPSKR